MTITELLDLVKERLAITSKDVSVKLSYQYPEWVAMGDKELDMPQYITDDPEVGVFVRMRRAIEEVDLYVSIVRFAIGWKEVPPRKHIHANEDGADNCMEEEE